MRQGKYVLQKRCPHTFIDYETIVNLEKVA
jgi:hypothetical protein